MKFWQAGFAAFSLSAIVGLMVFAETLEPQADIERVEGFSELDYNVFDRDFKLGKETCDVGLAKHRMCFKSSPLQTQIAKGEKLQQHIPVMAAEFPILLATPRKAEHQKLLRYGTKLVLMNENTLMIEDIIDLGIQQT